MSFSRRTAVKLIGGSPFLAQAQEKPDPHGPIDRHSLVNRHNVVLSAIEPACPLTVGNGEFAFNADVTGLQTLSDHYAENGVPLCTQSQWGWHSFPNHTGQTANDFQPVEFTAAGRQVGYAVSAKGQEPLYNYLRENPHRMNLGRIALVRRGGGKIRPDQVTGVQQKLDLWTGVLTSRFLFEGKEVNVSTCCHPERDALAFLVDSAAEIDVELSFPYGSPKISAADWTSQDRHSSVLNGRIIRRKLDADIYSAMVSAGVELAQTDPHSFVLRKSAQRAATTFEFAIEFLRNEATALDPSEIFAAARRHWPGFWSTGAAVECPGQPELERRVVLSQYLTAIQCAGSLPPQETGLTCNSWNGKFHLEMHWWHAAHFVLWDRPKLLERSMPWYQSILPSAIDKAKRQGYLGARWPKMTSADGFDSPSPIGPLLIWQQPHALHMAELLYRRDPKNETLEKYSSLVFATADFMASFAALHDGRYWLGPPVIPAQENHPPRETWNPTFELEYWHEGLRIAAEWRSRLQLSEVPAWTKVRNGLADLPVANGVYLAHANCPQTFTERNVDHPSMLMAMGMMPGAKADRATMRRTLDLVLKSWKWERTWGWDFGAVAMTAMRLGQPDVAMAVLLMDTPKNKWIASGHTPQRKDLPCYLPSNGALLSAVAMMAAKGMFHSEGVRNLL